MEEISRLLLKLYQATAEYTKLKLTDNKTNVKAILVMMGFLTLVPLLVMGLARHSRDGDYVVDTVYDVITILMSLFYCVIMSSLKEKNVYKLIRIISKDLFISCTPLSNEQLHIKRKAVKNSKFVLVVVLFTSIGGLIAKVSPFFIYLLQKFPDGIAEDEQVYLPIHCYVPTFINTVFRYAIAYGLIVVFLFIMTAVYIVGTLLFIVSIIYARKEISMLVVSLNELDGRCQLLQTEIKLDFVRKTIGTNLTLPPENYVHVCLSDVIQHHNAIIR